jgi:hypothetical protein
LFDISNKALDKELSIERKLEDWYLHLNKCE